jgi:hypothetical protein
MVTRIMSHRATVTLAAPCCRQPESRHAVTVAACHHIMTVMITGMMTVIRMMIIGRGSHAQRVTVAQQGPPARAGQPRRP